MIQNAGCIDTNFLDLKSKLKALTEIYKIIAFSFLHISELANPRKQTVNHLF